MATKNEKENVTGLDLAPDYQEAEYDLVTSLLMAANYKEEEITRVKIARAGKLLFYVNIHPLSDADVRDAQKKAGIYKPNPTNKKLGTVKVDTDNAKLSSWLIYLATTEEDQMKIWGNPAVMSRYGLMLPVESIDLLLTAGEKDMLFDELSKITDMPDEELGGEGDGDNETMDEVEYAKN